MPTAARAPAVVARRGALVESRHSFSAAICRLGGATASVGATPVAQTQRLGPPFASPWRSAAKPFQLEVSLACLPAPVAAALLADEPLLAIAAASHSAEPRHIALVDRLLATLGLTPAALRCGTHRPMNEAAADAVLRAGGGFDARHNNCSGKHAAMAAAAAALDADAPAADADYRAPSHPLQRRVAALVEALTAAEARWAGDGCGVPTFEVDVDAMARAYAALALAMRDAPSSPRGRIGWAMARHPELTSGEGRFDLHLARRATAPIAGKIGAIGVFCIAVPDARAGIGVKVHDGSTVALAAAVEAALERWLPGLLAPRPEAWPPTTTRDVAGQVVGTLSVTGDTVEAQMDDEREHDPQTPNLR